MELSPMNQEDYASFCMRSIKDFAQEKVEVGTWVEEEMQQLAEESYDST
ncbi:hypothetical protein [Paenibacillus pabuli]